MGNFHLSGIHLSHCTFRCDVLSHELLRRLFSPSIPYSLTYYLLRSSNHSTGFHIHVSLQLTYVIPLRSALPLYHPTSYPIPYVLRPRSSVIIHPHTLTQHPTPYPATSYAQPHSHSYTPQPTPLPSFIHLSALFIFPTFSPTIQHHNRCPHIPYSTCTLLPYLLP